MKTLVLGMGNPILSDDGVGFYVAEKLKSRLAQKADITVMETSQAGMSLLDLLIGFDRAIIIDAIQTVGGEAGQVHVLTLEGLVTTRRTALEHGMSFANIVEFGKMLGMAVPPEIVIFAIEVAEVNIFHERCTPKVRDSIPVCVDMVMKKLEGAQ